MTAEQNGPSIEDPEGPRPTSMTEPDSLNEAVFFSMQVAMNIEYPMYCKEIEILSYPLEGLRRTSTSTDNYRDIVRVIARYVVAVSSLVN